MLHVKDFLLSLQLFVLLLAQLYLTSQLVWALGCTTDQLAALAAKFFLLFLVLLLGMDLGFALGSEFVGVLYHAFVELGYYVLATVEDYLI